MALPVGLQLRSAIPVKEPACCYSGRFIVLLARRRRHLRTSFSSISCTKLHGASMDWYSKLASVQYGHSAIGSVCLYQWSRNTSYIYGMKGQKNTPLWW